MSINLANNILCNVQKEDRRTGELQHKGVVLYTCNCGTIQDSVLVGDIPRNTRPYFGTFDSEGMINYAHSDFSMNRGYETEFITDASQEDIENAIQEHLEFKIFDLEDELRRKATKEEISEALDAIYLLPKFNYIKENLLYN